MNLKNYTTSVSAEKSIAETEKLLAGFGASAIMKEYLSDGRLRSMSFRLGNKGFKLPVNVEGVYNVMFAGKRHRDMPNAKKNREIAAYNVAWRILKDWVHSQLSIIASGQASPEELLLPFMFDGKRTLYEAYKDGTLKLSHDTGVEDVYLPVSDAYSQGDAHE